MSIQYTSRHHTQNSIPCSAFASQYLKVLNWAKLEHKPAGVIVADYVSGNMNAGDRSRKINQLKTLCRAEIFN